MMQQIDYVIFETECTHRIICKRPLVKCGKIVPNKYGIVGIFDVWNEKNPRLVIDCEKIKVDLEEIQNKFDMSEGTVVVKKTFTNVHKLVSFVRDYVMFLKRMDYCYMAVNLTRCHCTCNENKFLEDIEEFQDSEDYGSDCEIKKFDKSFVEDMDDEDVDEEGRCSWCICRYCLKKQDIDFGMCINYEICDNFIVIKMYTQSD